MRNFLVVIVFLLCVLFIDVIDAQDCKVGGKLCADHEQCCGGCCFDGTCTDTYRSCQSSLDVCREHTCVGAQNCVPYTPPQCAGCDPIPTCRDVFMK